MRQRERIPLHDHHDGNSGGLVASSTIVSLVGGGGGDITATVAFGDPVAVGTALDDGSLSVAARADHVHTNTYLGTVLVSGTPAADDVLKATGAGTATWQAGAAASVVWYDEGVAAGTAGIVNITGAGTVSVSGGTATIDIAAGTAGGGGSVVFYDEGNVAGTAAIINVVGSGGTVAVSGGTATITITAGTAASAFAGARVYNSANISLTATTETTLTYNSERYDTDGYHSTSSNTSRLTIPTGKAGKYHIGANVSITTTPGLPTYIRLRLNGTTTIAVAHLYENASFVAGHISCDYDLAEGDYVEFQVYVQNASKNALAAANYSPEFWLHKIN